MSDLRPRRSALFLPASNARAIEKARTLPCDVVILDLEDAVAPEQKQAAREAAVAAARTGGFGARELVLRVNGLDSPWAADDLAAAGSAPFDAVLVPKVNAAADIDAVQAQLQRAPIWAMIETCRAIPALGAIAAAAERMRLQAFVIGTNDLAKELRCRLSPDRAELLPLLSLALAAGRGWGLTVLDGVHNAIDDDAGFEAVCRQGAAMGFDGKTLIHPRQIAACNVAFSPTDEQVAQARAIVDAFATPDATGKGAIRLGGAMVERLHLEEAHRILALAGQARGQ
ncbi:HpcH/HpaI aldolase/citrate lyase family protein [Sphingomonas desiccabilis]|uniref:CoA ester lyase n=1 Tax=Sphingomonas desiccabilis TaxID=429134 RepID=A0A4Q2IVW9_9SPHN|nr:CoA ester lyase [Sphingomonas desiccabilis]MBB3910206.1 citrate lyase subunit beta/citryl-CoA lyase [Sphingomonas desiccabilis]RXZ34879.1 CoA ester lyase [Sphingomonas desiccabilis]